MKLNKATALRIKMILKEKNIALNKLEEISGLKHCSITDILDCKNQDLDFINVALIIKALDISISEFFNSTLFDFDKLELEITNICTNTLTDIFEYQNQTTSFTYMALIIKALGMSMTEFFNSNLFDFKNLELLEK